MELRRLLILAVLTSGCGPGVLKIPDDTTPAPPDDTTPDGTTPDTGAPVSPCGDRDTDDDGNVDVTYAASIEAGTYEGTLWYVSLDDAVAHALQDGHPQIEVCPGTHQVATVRVGAGQTLTLLGVGGRDQTFVEPATPGLVAQVTGADAELTLEGLTLRGAVGGALSAANGAALILRDGRVQGTEGSGITARGFGVPTTVTIERSEIVDNDAGTGSGGGIDLRGVVVLVASDSLVAGNHAANGGGLSVRPYDGGDPPQITLASVEVSDNVADEAGGGLFGHVAGLSVVLQDTTIFTGNRADVGAGMRLVDAEVVGTGGPTIEANVATTTGGGVSIVRSQVSGLEVLDNEAGRAGGVHVGQLDGTGGLPDSTLDDVVVDGNLASFGGGLYVASGESVSVTGGAVTDNDAGDLGGGALIPTGATLVSVGVDWGTQAADNTTYDVELPDVGANGVQYDAYGANASFACDGDVGCADL